MHWRIWRHWGLRIECFPLGTDLWRCMVSDIWTLTRWSTDGSSKCNRSCSRHDHTTKLLPWNIGDLQLELKWKASEQMHMVLSSWAPVHCLSSRAEVIPPQIMIKSKNTLFFYLFLDRLYCVNCAIGRCKATPRSMCRTYYVWAWEHSRVAIPSFYDVGMGFGLLSNCQDRNYWLGSHSTITVSAPPSGPYSVITHT